MGREIKNFKEFVFVEKINERFNKLPGPSERKVKKISINFFNKIVEAYAGYDEYGTYLMINDDNWKILNESIKVGRSKANKIVNVLNLNDKNKIIQFELDDNTILNCRFNIKIFNKKKDI